ncbi:MAG: asparaginase domain-containing protein [Firmicutes bacterium]|nr:asparaginase domain-containing protein [Bacillota bacterium]MCL2255764.1 asparaginase domain-containing protein [Bacillota bacterium]
MKNLTLLTTGGTISTMRDGSALTAGKANLLDAFNGIIFKKSVAVCNVLSENMDLKIRQEIANAIEKECKSCECDGIILTHGTDTLAYSATYLALKLSHIKIPVVIVSADYPLNDERSNGFANMQKAVEFIQRTNQVGVFVSYKNPGEETKIHYGARMLRTRAFDGHVSSAGETMHNSQCTAHSAVQLDFGNNFTLSPDSKGIFLVEPYTVDPYNDYKILSSILKNNYSACVVEGFHSGTANIEGLNLLAESGCQIYLTGGKEGNNQYAGQEKLDKRIKVFQNITTLALYYKLVLSSEMKELEREKFLKSNIANEYF